MQDQLLDAPIHDFSNVDFVFRGARDFVNPAELLGLFARAAKDARRRAEAYAGALGLPLGALVAAAEAGTPSSGSGAEFGAFGFSIPVHAGEVDVTAALDVTYELGAG